MRPTVFTLLLILCWIPQPAYAHSSERGLVLLLPTAFAITGGGIAVLASFLLLGIAPGAVLRRIAGARIPLWTMKYRSPMVTSLLGFLVMVLLLVAGFLGPHDPLSNPLSLGIWTLWWVGFALLNFVLGDLWRLFNPWYGPWRLLRGLTGQREAPFTLPRGLGYWPAIVLFFAFAWFELVYWAPEDPEILALTVLVYWLVTLVAIGLFGYRDWMQRGEPFAIFFRLLGSCSPLIREEIRSAKDAGETRVRVFLGWPGQGFLQQAPLPLSGVLFVIAVLSSSSFDGFSETFTWMAWMGINPLEYPGRSGVVLSNTLGLFAAFLVLAALFVVAAGLGLWLAAGDPGRRPRPGEALGALVYSIVPIALAFHIAHYLTLLLVNGQYVLKVFTDPFNRGWNLFGLAGDFHVTVSFLNNIHDVSIIWYVQTLVIVLGHLVGILLAHLVALGLYHRAIWPLRAAARSQWALALLMVGYTVFGLWLLSTATIG